MYFISLLLSLLNFFLRYLKIPILCYFFSFYLTLILIQPNILCSFHYFNTQSIPNLPYVLQCIYFIFGYFSNGCQLCGHKESSGRAHIFDRSGWSPLPIFLTTDHTPTSPKASFLPNPNNSEAHWMLALKTSPQKSQNAQCWLFQRLFSLWGCHIYFTKLKLLPNISHFGGL